MAYCLRSLVHTLDQVLNPDQHHRNWVLNPDQEPQIRSLFENAVLLQKFLDDSSPLIQEQIASLEDQIMKAAEKAQDTLESYIISQVPEIQTFTIPELGDVLQAFEVAKQEMIQIKDAGQPSAVAVSGRDAQASSKMIFFLFLYVYFENMYVSSHSKIDNLLRFGYSLCCSWKFWLRYNVKPPVSSTRNQGFEHVVGVEKDLNQLRSRLIADAPNLDIIPIVGMGGIGKTTLARILYDEFAPTKSHFDIFAWVTVSQSYSLLLILRSILVCLTGEPISVEQQKNTTSELIVTLHKKLIGRRYLIVLDDVWSRKAWDAVQTTFQKDNNQRSRIILTTRRKDVAIYASPKCHEMDLINKDDSWKLLSGKVFGETDCPPEMEKVGKKIAIKCGGLPLALEVIGGLLSQSERSKYFWDQVASDVSSSIAKTNDQFSGIFSSSFNYLPHYLKPCLLYMGAFPEDHAIRASKIIQMLVAEGFLCPFQDKSLEEAAEKHLDALVQRNLIFIRERKTNGKAKSYGIHDLLRDLCSRKAQQKKFLFVKKSKTKIREDPLCFPRVSVLSLDRCEDEDNDDHKEHFSSMEKLISAAIKFTGAASLFFSFQLTSFAFSIILIAYLTCEIMSYLRSKLPRNDEDEEEDGDDFGNHRHHFFSIMLNSLAFLFLPIVPTNELPLKHILSAIWSLLIVYGTFNPIFFA